MVAPKGCPAECLERAPGPLSQAEKDYVSGVLHFEPNSDWKCWEKAEVLRFIGYVRARKEEPEPGISGLRFVCLHTPS